jgi:hypothetical protein
MDDIVSIILGDFNRIFILKEIGIKGVRCIIHYMLGLLPILAATLPWAHHILNSGIFGLGCASGFCPQSLHLILKRLAVRLELGYLLVKG